MAVSFRSKECWAIRDPTPAIPLMFEDFPDETLLEIFKELSQFQQFKCAFVCRRWRRILMEPFLLGPVSYLKLRYPKLTVIDETVWKASVDTEQYELSFADAKPIDWLSLDPILFGLFKHITPFRKKLFRKYPRANPGIAEDAGVTILTIPKGLSLQNMWKMAIDLRRKEDVSYKVPEMIDINPHCHTLLLTNNVFNQTGWMSRAESKRFLKGVGMTLPTPLALYCLIVMRNIMDFVKDERLWRMKEAKKVFLASGKKESLALVISPIFAMVPAYISQTPCDWANYGPMGMINLEQGL